MNNFKKARLFDAGGDLSKRWYVFYAFASPETGKFQRFRLSISDRILTASGRREKAHEIIKSINQKLNQGFNPFAHQEKKYTSITIALNYALDVKKEVTRKRTYFTYRYLVVSLLKWLGTKKLENMAIENFNYYHAQEFMDYSKSVLKLSNNTCNYRTMHLKSMFTLLIKREWILINPFDKIDRLQVEEPEIVSFSTNDLVTMQRYLPEWNYDLYVCACLIFYCFIRPQEIMRLKVEYFQLSTRSIIIPGTVSKNKKHEMVQIPDALMPVLRRLDLNFPGDYFVFTRHLKRSQKEAAPTRMAGYWREFADHYGIKKNIYSLKHTGVGLAIENGINLRDLQLQLRHWSLEMTQVYLDKFKRRPSEKLARDFPDLASMGRNTAPVYSPLPSEIYKTSLS
ncbi:MAG: tyrosine-type recombinase/integrase [Bacteroidales bacterium]